MNIEKQCCTLEQAKRLQELGITAKGFLSWACKGAYYCDNIEYAEEPPFIAFDCSEYSYPYKFIAYAFTCAELGAMLPAQIKLSNELYPIVFYKDIDNKYYAAQITKQPVSIGFNTQAECKADRLIYLLEKNLVTAEYCNQQLNDN